MYHYNFEEKATISEIEDWAKPLLKRGWHLTYFQILNEDSAEEALTKWHAAYPLAEALQHKTFHIYFEERCMGARSPFEWQIAILFKLKKGKAEEQRFIKSAKSLLKTQYTSEELQKLLRLIA